MFSDNSTLRKAIATGIHGYCHISTLVTCYVNRNQYYYKISLYGDIVPIKNFCRTISIKSQDSKHEIILNLMHSQKTQAYDSWYYALCYLMQNYNGQMPDTDEMRFMKRFINKAYDGFLADYSLIETQNINPKIHKLIVYI